MMQHFDQTRGEGRGGGVDEDGAGIKTQAAPEKLVNAEIIKEVFGIHGSGWRRGGGRDEILVRMLTNASSLQSQQGVWVVVRRRLARGEGGGLWRKEYRLGSVKVSLRDIKDFLTGVMWVSESGIF